MNKFELKLRKSLRKIFNCFSLTAVAFIFQACYGPDGDFGYDVKLTGTVTSKTTNMPIKGIKVAVGEEGYNYGFTDENGKFEFYASVPYWDYSKDEQTEDVYIHFLDVDGIENGHFADTTITVKPAHKDEIKMIVELNEIQ